jgi:HD superfamily phosphohydrolase
LKAITHRDEIYRDARYDPLASALLDTEELQRLGRIYQLGYAHLVFRGGTHTRLSHALGTAHVAGQIVGQLRRNYLEAPELPLGAVALKDFLPGFHEKPLDFRWDALDHLVRWAALLYGVGHIPAGDTLEDSIEGIYRKRGDLASPRVAYLWHETAPGRDSEIRAVFRRADLLPSSFQALGITGEDAWKTVLLICLHKESGEGEERKSFEEILAEEKRDSEPFVRVVRQALSDTQRRVFFPYMADIVGNAICADLLDYVQRDSANIGLGITPDGGILSRFFVGRNDRGACRMALSLSDGRGPSRSDTATAIELLHQRFRCAEIIYHHKTKIAASAMLAKAFILVGKPEEVGSPRRQLDIEEIAALAVQLAHAGESDAVAELKKECLPNGLLDPGIGDETLLLWLQSTAWDKLEHAAKQSDRETTEKCLRGISLLQALARRKLYKVAASIDRDEIERLSPGSKQDAPVDRRIALVLQELRKDSATRSRIERELAQAAGWPEDSLLLHVPERNGQAKGIETAVLDRGDLLTLGAHSVVANEIAQLNNSYKGLWKITVLAHPRYRDDAIGLSKALDALIAELCPGARENYSTTVALRDIAWFPYIAPRNRPAAEEYRDLIAPEAPDWKRFEDAARSVEGTTTSREHADRAFLLSTANDPAAAFEALKREFGAAGSLLNRMGVVQKEIVVESIVGIDDLERRRAILNRILTDILPKDARSETPRRRKIKSPNPQERLD